MPKRTPSRRSPKAPTTRRLDALPHRGALHECSKLIIQAGIKRVVYCEEYRSEEGLDLLRKVGIECVQREIDDH